EWAWKIPTSDPAQSVLVKELVGSCFLANDKPTGQPPADTVRPYTDPLRRSSETGMRRQSADPHQSAHDLHRAARSRELLGGLLQDSAVIEERRSAFIGIVAESAARIAERGIDSTNAWAPHEPDGIDCRDLGLTFWVTDDELKELFAE